MGLDGSLMYQYTGTYHGVSHSHLDSVDCHMMVDGKGYIGRTMEDINAAGGCPKGSIDAVKDGVVTRAILFDRTRSDVGVIARESRRHPARHAAYRGTRS